uniref:Uncharacterized protein n=2 Tax=viral metagenome TaxID=1070528 RepID=A0A6M3M7W8_9ZZZZ
MATTWKIERARGHRPGYPAGWVLVRRTDNLEDSRGGIFATRREARAELAWREKARAAEEALRAAAEQEAPCSLCGTRTGIAACGAAWYLCPQCEGTAAAAAAGYTHD